MVTSIPPGNRAAHQREAGIGNPRSAGVTDERNRLPLTQQPDQAFARLTFVVFVKGNQRFMNIVVLKQDAALARIFARNNIYRAQRFLARATK